jgi:hypothetical protein
VRRHADEQALRRLNVRDAKGRRRVLADVGKLARRAGAQHLRRRKCRLRYLKVRHRDRPSVSSAAPLLVWIAISMAT